MPGEFNPRKPPISIAASSTPNAFLGVLRQNLFWIICGGVTLVLGASVLVLEHKKASQSEEDAAESADSDSSSQKTPQAQGVNPRDPESLAARSSSLDIISRLNPSSVRSESSEPPAAPPAQGPAYPPPVMAPPMRTATVPQDTVRALTKLTQAAKKPSDAAKKESKLSMGFQGAGNSSGGGGSSGGSGGGSGLATGFYRGTAQPTPDTGNPSGGIASKGLVATMKGLFTRTPGKEGASSKTQAGAGLSKVIPARPGQSQGGKAPVSTSGAAAGSSIDSTALVGGAGGALATSGAGLAPPVPGAASGTGGTGSAGPTGKDGVGGTRGAAGEDTKKLQEDCQKDGGSWIPRQGATRAHCDMTAKLTKECELKGGVYDPATKLCDETEKKKKECENKPGSMWDDGTKQCLNDPAFARNKANCEAAGCTWQDSQERCVVVPPKVLVNGQCVTLGDNDCLVTASRQEAGRCIINCKNGRTCESTEDVLCPSVNQVVGCAIPTCNATTCGGNQQYCNQNQCDHCPSGRFNCDGTGGCESATACGAAATCTATNCTGTDKRCVGNQCTTCAANTYSCDGDPTNGCERSSPCLNSSQACADYCRGLSPPYGSGSCYANCPSSSTTNTWASKGTCTAPASGSCCCVRYGNTGLWQ